MPRFHHGCAFSDNDSTPGVAASAAKIEPWERSPVEAIVNKRSSRLDLDCIYGDEVTLPTPPVDTDGLLTLDDVVDVYGRPPNKDLQNDLPRTKHSYYSPETFIEKTPLWFYILAEAVREKHNQPDHDYLGPVGSHIVAGVLMGLLLKSQDSILENGISHLGTKLTDLLRLGGVL
jgi:hypothetical protein